VISEIKRQVPPANKTLVRHERGNNKDLRRVIEGDFPRAVKQTAKIARRFQGKTVLDTVRNIHQFLRQNFVYLKDSEQYQVSKLPARFLSEQTGDCKSYSLFAASILANLGIPVGFKYAGYMPGSIVPTHIYVVAQDEKGKTLILDGTNPNFGIEKPPFYSYVKPLKMRIATLSDEVLADEMLADQVLADQVLADENFNDELTFDAALGLAGRLQKMTRAKRLAFMQKFSPRNRKKLLDGLTKARINRGKDVAARSRPGQVRNVNRGKLDIRQSAPTFSTLNGRGRKGNKGKKFRRVAANFLLPGSGLIAKRMRAKRAKQNKLRRPSPFTQRLQRMRAAQFRARNKRVMRPQIFSGKLHNRRIGGGGVYGSHMPYGMCGIENSHMPYSMSGIGYVVYDTDTLAGIGGKKKRQKRKAKRAAKKTKRLAKAKPGSRKARVLTRKVKKLNIKATTTGKDRKTALKSFRKERRGEIKQAAKNVGTFLQKINPVVAAGRGAFLALVALNFGGYATAITKMIAAKEEAKLKKTWSKKFGGKWERLVKAANKGKGKKPLFRKKKGVSGIGEPVTIGASVTAASVVLASIGPIMKKFLGKKGEEGDGEASVISDVVGKITGGAKKLIKKDKGGKGGGKLGAFIDNVKEFANNPKTKEAIEAGKDIFEDAYELATTKAAGDEKGFVEKIKEIKAEKEAEGDNNQVLILGAAAVALGGLVYMSQKKK